MGFKWFRPNSFCCQQQDHPHAQSSSSKSLAYEDIYLEPVIQLYLLGHVELSVGSNRKSAVIDGERQTSPTRDSSYLKLGAQFWPHATFQDLSPTVGGSVPDIINDEGKDCGMYANISFEQLGEFMMPKAVDCLSRSLEATSYQMLWKTKHGSSYLRVEKTSWRATTRKHKVVKRRNKHQHKKFPVQGWTSANSEFISSWIAHVPAQLQSLYLDYWTQKAKLSTLPLLSKTNACVHGCPITVLPLLGKEVQDVQQTLKP